MANLQRVWELSPAYAQVERVPVPRRAAFFERYVLGCRPAVFTGVADDWPIDYETLEPFFTLNARMMGG